VALVLPSVVLADFTVTNTTHHVLWVNGVTLPAHGTHVFTSLTEPLIFVSTGNPIPNTDFEASFTGLEANGGSAVVRAPARPWGIPGNLLVDVYDMHGVFQQSSDPHAQNPVRDVQLLATADCQFANGDGSEARYWRALAYDLLAKAFEDLNPEAPDYRGLIVAGDLTSRTATDELEFYRAGITGKTRFVYDSVGNHDLHWSGDGWLTCCDRVGDLIWPGDDCCSDPAPLINDVTHRHHTTMKTNKTTTTTGGYYEYTFETTAPLYSWDWHDVHFVQLGLVPGGAFSQGTLADRKCEEIYETDVSCPFPAFNSLDFLEDDLEEYVGTSGRPVVLIHHYLLGSGVFSTEESFTEPERLAYWEVIKDYNVVAILTGHAHPSATGTWRIPWSRPDDATGGPDTIQTYVVGAARGPNPESGGPDPAGTRYTELSINGANQIRVARKNKDGATVGTPHRFSFGDSSTPLFVDGNEIAPGGGYGHASTPFKAVGYARDAIASAWDVAGLTAPSKIEIGAGYYEGEAELSFPVHVGPVTLTANGGCVVLGGSPSPTDSCADAATVCGSGTFEFENSSATSNGPGTACGAIDRDQWFEWKPATDGNVTVDTCAQTTVDTVLAVYEGSSCAVGSPVACNDDGCGQQSSLSFFAEAGRSYLIRVGTAPGQPGGSGSVRISSTELSGDFTDLSLDSTLEDPDLGPGATTSFVGGAAVFSGDRHYLRTRLSDYHDRHFVAEGTFTVADPNPSSAIALNEDFEDLSLPATLEDPDAATTTTTFDTGEAVFSGGRHFLRTVATGYADSSFIAEGTLTFGSSTGDGIAFFGMGPGTNGGAFDGPDLPTIYAEIAPGGFAGGYFRAMDGSQAGPGFGGGWAVGTKHRVRFSWHAQSETAVVELDQNYTGGAFEADFVTAVIGRDNGFTPANSRIFFGANGNTSWDDISIVATPLATPDLTEDFSDLSLPSTLQDPDGFSERSSVFFGADGGSSWDDISIVSSSPTILDVDEDFSDLVRPYELDDPDGVLEDSRVFFGADGGASWDDISIVSSSSLVDDLIEDFSDPVLSSRFDDPNGFSKSHLFFGADGGSSWDDISIVTSSFPAYDLTENFSAGTLPTKLEDPNAGDPGPTTTFTGGQAVFSDGRHYLRTKLDAYANVSFVAEGTLTLGAAGPEAIAFLGMGPGTNGGAFNGPDVPHVYAEVSPSGFLGGYFRAIDNGVEGPFYGQSNGGWGVGTKHRVRFTWDAPSQTAVIELDQNYTGVFVADFTTTQVNGGDNGFIATELGGGEAVFNHGRHYLRTRYKTYANDRFVAEGTLTLGSGGSEGIAFFGMGPGTNGGAFNGPDVPHVYGEVSPFGFVGGYFRAVDNGAVGPYYGQSNGGWGVGTKHRMRFTWDAPSQTAVIELDQNYTGGVFVADFVTTQVFGGDNGFSGTSFTAGEALFDNGRHYLRTAVGRYATDNFVAEGTLTLGAAGPEGMGFFGMGPGTNGGAFNAPDLPTVYAEIAPEGFVGGYFRAVDNTAPAPYHGQSNGGWGVGTKHRVRFTWDAPTQSAVIELDQNYNGFFVADFTTAAVPGGDNGFTNTSFSGGEAVFDSGRHYLRTAVRNYAFLNFVAEGTLTLGSAGSEGISFFGIGPGTNGGAFDGPSTPAIYAEIAPGGFAGGFFRAVDDTVGGPAFGGGWAVGTVHRVRFTWDALSQTALIELDENYSGSFVPDFATAVIGGDNGFTPFNSRIFFGGDGGSSWDDISVHVAVSEGSGFFGMGPGTNGGVAHLPDLPTIYAEVAPAGFSGGFFRAFDDLLPAGPLYGNGVGGWDAGTMHRVRLSWNPVSEQALVQLDKNHSGAFVADFSEWVDGRDNNFSMADTNIFFGADGGSSWDDVTVNAIPIPPPVLSEEFTGPSMPPTLVSPNGGTTTFSGEAVFSGGRHYLRTVVTDYVDDHFIAEGTLTLGHPEGPGIGFFGMGTGTNGGPFATPDPPSIYAEIAPGGHAGGGFHVDDDGVEVGPWHGHYNGGWGVGTRHRVRITWNPVTEEALVELDQNYDGFFVADFSDYVDGSDNAFTTGNTSIFFGADALSSWDDVSIVVLPTP
jgi:hypothetical protein